MNVAAIRLLIRQKLDAGRLPRDSTPRAFGRPGNWQKCAACDETMMQSLPMMELYPRPNDKTSVRLHRDCFTLWNAERQTKPS
jgi:hypothetical protein